MKKNIEVVVITLLLVLIASLVLILYLDPSADHTYATGVFGIFLAILIFYIDKKYFSSEGKELESATQESAKDINRRRRSKFRAPAELEFTLLIVSILILNNLFLSGFQYSVEDFKLPEATALTLLLVFSGNILFLSLLPLSALGSILIGMRSEQIRWRHCIVASSFTFGCIAILTATHWIATDSFSLVTILGALFTGNAHQMLPLHGKMLMAALTIAVDLLLVLFVSLWLLVWAKIGSWRFKRIMATS